MSFETPVKGENSKNIVVNDRYYIILSPCLSRLPLSFTPGGGGVAYGQHNVVGCFNLLPCIFLLCKSISTDSKPRYSITVK